MKTIKLDYQIDPQPKGRPRFWNGRALTPKKTRVYESVLKKLTKLKYAGELIEGPVSVTIMFVIKRPKTIKRKHPTVVPDLDNLVKAVTDSWGSVLKNDSQIVSLLAQKAYGDEGAIYCLIEELQPA